MKLRSEGVRGLVSPSAVVDRLRAAGCVFAEEEARLLLDAARTPADLTTMVEQRVSGLPLEQILGWAEFCGLRIAVEPGVFVPRRRTEFLARQAVSVLLADRGGRPVVVVDLCCGSGAVAAAVRAGAQSGGPVELYAADIDPVAVRCARRNLAATGAAVYEGNLYEPLPATLRGRIDILVANVPYVPSDAIDLMPPEARLHESRLALDGGGDGLDVLRRLATGARSWLAPAGSVLVETSEEQAPYAVSIVTAAGLAARVATSEEFGATVIIGRRPLPEHGAS